MLQLCKYPEIFPWASVFSPSGTNTEWRLRLPAVLTSRPQLRHKCTPQRPLPLSEALGWMPQRVPLRADVQKRHSSTRTRSPSGHPCRSLQASLARVCRGPEEAPAPTWVALLSLQVPEAAGGHTAGDSSP